MKPEQLQEKLWGVLIAKIQTELDRGVKQKVLAERIQVTPTTINRWYKGKRSDRIPLRELCKIIIYLGVSMSEIAEAIGDRQAVLVAHYLENENSERVKRFASIVERGGPYLEKLGADIDIIYNEMPKNE